MSGDSYDIELPDGPLHFVSKTEADNLRAEIDRLRDFILSRGMSASDRAEYLKIDSYMSREARER